jgi:glutamyl-tRNA synthetase
VQEKINKSNAIRVRFAPSPTGMLHLGNMRTALMNYIFAMRYQGTFILRIEDTDQQRNFDPEGKKIIEDMNWLGFAYTEGPYYQSTRTALYQRMLDILYEKEQVYRCFCSQEALEQRRQRQLALKLPPRYERTCATLEHSIIAEQLEQQVPFVWRMKVDASSDIILQDLARGHVSFNLKHFSDFPLTRQDGSFTFIFANCIDDIDMNITHVLRGEDHLSNTVNQAVIYRALNATVPVFWHTPMICNVEGKKLSKRDFGFSLNDLRDAGYLPEAINNYMGIIGGSFENEIMSATELADAIDFEKINATGHIKYDVEKLTWVNHKWISTYDTEKLASLCLPHLASEYPDVYTLEKKVLIDLIKLVQSDIKTLKECVKALTFYWHRPVIMHDQLPTETPSLLTKIIQEQSINMVSVSLFMENVKTACAQTEIPLKKLFPVLRYALTGSQNGASVLEIMNILGVEETRIRLAQLP